MGLLLRELVDLLGHWRIEKLMRADAQDRTQDYRRAFTAEQLSAYVSGGCPHNCPADELGSFPTHFHTPIRLIVRSPDESSAEQFVYCRPQYRCHGESE